MFWDDEANKFRSLSGEPMDGATLSDAYIRCACGIEIWKKYKDKILLPVDLIDAKDIGEESIKIFKEEIKNSASIFISGPMGVFEEEKYRKGTEEILKAIANSNAFSMAGGGHTVAAINMLGLEDKFTYISTGGGSLERMLMGEKLPVIEALIKFKR